MEDAYHEELLPDTQNENQKENNINLMNEIEEIQQSSSPAQKTAQIQSMKEI